MTVLVIVLSPILKAKQFKNNLLGQPITVIIERFDDDYNAIELYRTEGMIEDIVDGVVDIKRKTQPNFKVPFIREQFIDVTGSHKNGAFTIVHVVASASEVDPNSGINTNL